MNETFMRKAGVERPIRVLHLEDDPRDVELIQRRLKAEGLSCDIIWVDGRQAFESALEREAFDLVLADYNLRDYDGMSALRRVHEKRPEVPVIVISGTLGEEEAVECLKAGATDYVLKQRLQRLGAAVARAFREAEQRQKRRQAEEALRESEARVRLTIDTALDAVVTMDAEGLICDWNAQAEAVFGWKREEAVGKPMTELIIPPRYREGHAHGLKHFLVAGEGPLLNRRIEVMALRRDGREFPVELSIAAMTVKGAWMFSGFARDITERKEHEEKIARLSRIHALLSAINSLIVRTRDRQELFRESCRIAVEHGGLALAWIGLAVPGASKVAPVAWWGADAGYLAEVGLMLEKLLEDPGSAGRALKEKRAIISNDIERDPAVVFAKEALTRGFRSLAVFPLGTDQAPAGVFILYAALPGFFDTEETARLSELASNISFALDHIEKEERLDYLAYYDKLTGLPNRSLFYERVNGIFHAAKKGNRASGALVVLDLERFRTINETLGLHAGDAVLKEVARRLSGGQLGAERLARISGDLFAAVLGDLRRDSDVAHFLKREMIDVLQEPFRVAGRDLRITAKAGIALFPGDGTDAESLFRNAEAALKRAKDTGDRYLFYSPEFNARVADRLDLESRLRRALEERQFVLRLQAKVDAVSGAIVGAEALIRWNDPKEGLIPPARFIPILEETGLIVEVGDWALEEAARIYERLRGRGVACPRIAVNVSQVQMRRRDFPREVVEAVRRGSSEQHGVDIEITESLLAENIDEAVRKLAHLREAGFCVSVDDFGTGYSSLRYLASLPVDALKIDRSFIITMDRDANSMAIVTTIINLAHSFRLKVIAEGVDSDEQLKLLRLLRCDEIQGFLFHKPLSEAEFEALLRQSSGKRS